MKKLIILILIFSMNYIYAEFPVYYSAGIKIGFNLSGKSNFHIGPEISFIENIGKNKQYFTGAYLNLDFYMNGKIAFNPGIEIQFEIAPGVAFGPSVLIESDTTHIGINAALYSGFIFHPYFGYFWYPERKSFFDTGFFIKIPFGKYLPDMSIG